MNADLIRRVDALKALDWGDIYGRNAQAAISALPAATVRVPTVDELARMICLSRFDEKPTPVPDPLMPFGWHSSEKRYRQQAERILAALSAAPVGVRVKPLEWDESIKGRWIGTPPVKLGDLAFWIFCRDDGTFMRATKDGGQFFPNLEAAKAAAQADYEARIMAALTPAPADDVRRATLMEAEKALRDWQDSLNANGMQETAIPVGIAADVVIALIEKDTK